MHYNSTVNYLGWMIAFIVIAFRCSAFACSHLIKFNWSRRNKPIEYSEALFAIIHIGIIVSELIFIYACEEQRGFPLYFSSWMAILGFTICGANMVDTNDRHDLKWVRFFIKDIIDETPLPAARG